MLVYYVDKDIGRVGMFIRCYGVMIFKFWYEKQVGDEFLSVVGLFGKLIEVKYYGNVVFVVDVVCV